ncbi:hypothetical protein BTJ40_03370 [Microbulbifer sp. A4B17]|uniref:hypothetical protein n=1 Tax=Microbulbifer sp. A4B17 TaxID=359370 RepID=UPI000D52D1C6|nr:hypothetical protein [Microbulbifer sp. A4B17]AWF79933.1 hypothetical protein BTJ40_03370 [Microbulbifer sp. A4B17]
MKFLLLAFSVLLFNPTHAEEEEQPEENQQTAAIIPKKEAPNTKGKSNSDDYKASEEISEDLSVSFPVDI